MKGYARLLRTSESSASDPAERAAPLENRAAKERNAFQTPITFVHHSLSSSLYRLPQTFILRVRGVFRMIAARVAPTVGAWRSLVAHLLWEQRVGGSNPLAPTNKNNQLRFYFCGRFINRAAPMPW